MLVLFLSICFVFFSFSCFLIFFDIRISNVNLRALVSVLIHFTMILPMNPQQVNRLRNQKRAQ